MDRNVIEKTSLEKANWLFKQDCEFLRGVEKASDLPAYNLPEVGFIGRSNVGKSSLINSLTTRHRLARTSNTPGRTQQLNFFKLNNQLILVDMPGYGYAQAPKQLVVNWTHLICDYLQTRINLKRVYVLVDSRHGLKPNDDEMMRLLDQMAVSYQIVLTKADKIPLKQAAAVYEQTQEQIKDYTAAYPHIIMTSSEDKRGIEQLRLAINEFIKSPPS